MTKALGRPAMSPGEIARFRTKVSAQALAIYQAEGFDKLSMRRLAKEIGCSATTLYAHFDGKIDILMQLWADVLAELIEQLNAAIPPSASPEDRLRKAAQSFVRYWVTQPDHFRLVFMSNDVSRGDVDGFINQPQVQDLLRLFETLVRDQPCRPETGKAQTEAIIAGLIGIAMCHNTMRGHDWTASVDMTDLLLSGVLSPDGS